MCVTCISDLNYQCYSLLRAIDNYSSPDCTDPTASLSCCEMLGIMTSVGEEAIFGLKDKCHLWKAYQTTQH
jgi:hypothetical protein